MRFQLKAILNISSLAFLFASVQIQASDITERLLDRNELLQLTQDPIVKGYLFDHDVIKRLNKQLVAEEFRNHVVNCQSSIGAFFKSKKVLGAMCYLLRNDNLGVRLRVLPLMRLYVQEMKLTLKEIAEDPRYVSAQGQAKRLYGEYKAMDMGAFEGCFQKVITYDYSQDPNSESFNPFVAVASCLSSKYNFLTKNLNELGDHPGHLVSETGWVSGNAVQYLSKNDLSPKILEEIQKRIHLIPELYPLSGRGSVNAMYDADPSEVFTEEEGFQSAATHFVWSQKSGIFKEIISALNNAQETIFVDIFFLGGSMGASLAKHIVALLEQKPQLKVLILRDQVNHFGHEKNMLPVFNYLLAYSYKNPTRLVILPSNIKNHLSGLPGFIEPILSDDLLNNTGLQGHLDLYGRAMSDHSKVFVIDGKTSHPVAFVGSKNLTDESGAFCYDHVAKIEGPSAAIVQDDYYLDMKYALRDVDYSQAPYKFSGAEPYVDFLAKAGWSADLYKTSQNKEEKIVNILKPFDLLERNVSLAPSVSKVSVEDKGSVLLRTGFTNVDSTRSSLIDEVVQLIKGAKTRVLIMDQFLFDRNVVLALIEAKKKNPALEIKAILEPLALANPKGMPNLLYLDRLKEVGIEVKWLLTYSFKPFVTGEAARMSPEELESLHEISQEVHMKTISADGKYVIVGSANKDQTTMYGAFREQQLDIYDTAATKVHDDTFFEYWNNPELTKGFEGFDFEVPENLKSIEGKTLSPKQFIVTLRNILSILYDWTTVY
ncbi:MAG: phospholipase D-like domain-containing protein [Bdellovibrionota bacterium]